MVDPQRTIERAEDRIVAERNKKEVISTLTGVVINELRPALENVALEIKNATESQLEGIRAIRIEPPQVDVNVPEVKVPEANVKVEIPPINVPEANVNVSIPEIKTAGIEKAIEKGLSKFKIPKIDTPKIPKITIPEIKIPEIRVPEANVNVSLPQSTAENPLPVILTDKDGAFYKAMMSVSGGGGSKRVEVIKPGMVDVINITMASANTEYSTALPANTVAMTFQCRGDYDIRFSYQTGKVASPTAPYMTLKAGMIYYETNLDLTSKTLYVACPTAAQVVEVIAYH